MKIAHDVLGRFVPVPEPHATRALLDDLGIEVKRFHEAPHGANYTLELLANRGDHHCYEGVARELGARLRASLQHPPYAKLELAAAGAAPWPVRVETPLCLRYSATLLERVGTGAEALPPADLRVLEAAELHSLGPAIDATNLANLELGQPTHAFDADRIEGAITIRTSRPGEHAWPLFREAPLPLPEGTLVVADEAKILAIAGVIGCEESKTTDQTTRLLLESATFDPVAVRKARRAIDIHTDSSARFERGADPERVLVGAGRVVHLLEGAGWRRVGATGLEGGWRDPERQLALDLDALDEFLGTRLSRADVTEILERLGYGVHETGERALRVRVPARRVWDVVNVQDLYEEVVRIVGYNETPILLPPVDQGALPRPEQDRKRRVDEVLVAAGFYEVFTDGFYGRDLLDKLGLGEDHPLRAHVETLNALDRGYSLLKNNNLGQAVEAVALNLHRRTAEIKAFEWTRTFHPVAHAEGESPCVERQVVWAIASGAGGPSGWAGAGRPADVWFLKGLVEELAAELGLDLQVGRVDDRSPIGASLHPGRQASILLDGAVVGILGEVHPAVLKAFKIKGARPVFLEIEASALLAEGSRPAYSEPPSWQPIVRNLAFTLPYAFEAGTVQAWLHAAGPDWLERVEIVDLFEHEEAGRPVRTVTFALQYTNPEPSRTTEEVNATTERLVEAVRSEFGDQGVKLR